MIPTPPILARRSGASVKAERAAARSVSEHGEHAALSSAAGALSAFGGAA